jgi:hypothetical protein
MNERLDREFADVLANEARKRARKPNAIPAAIPDTNVSAVVVQKMHPAEWARIRPCFTWTADGISPDVEAARLVMFTVRCRMRGVLK